MIFFLVNLLLRSHIFYSSRFISKRPSVTFLHPTQAIEIFGNVFTPFGTFAICDLSIKILQ